MYSLSFASFIEAHNVLERQRCIALPLELFTLRRVTRLSLPFLSLFLKWQMLETRIRSVWRKIE